MNFSKAEGGLGWFNQCFVARRAQTVHAQLAVCSRVHLCGDGVGWSFRCALRASRLLEVMKVSYRARRAASSSLLGDIMRNVVLLSVARQGCQLGPFATSSIAKH